VIAAAIVCPFVVFVVVHDSTFLDKGSSQRALGFFVIFYSFTVRWGMKILIIIIYRLNMRPCVTVEKFSVKINLVANVPLGDAY